VLARSIGSLESFSRVHLASLGEETFDATCTFEMSFEISTLNALPCLLASQLFSILPRYFLPLS